MTGERDLPTPRVSRIAGRPATRYVPEPPSPDPGPPLPVPQPPGPDPEPDPIGVLLPPAPPNPEALRG
jgi:hypothetical protein